MDSKPLYSIYNHGNFITKATSVSSLINGTQSYVYDESWVLISISENY